MINNPSTYSTLGINEETDSALRIRRQKSTELPSQGFYDGLFAALGNITSVSSVFLYENVTDALDSNGVPPHSIWAILSGNGAPADIAEAIYANRTLGCGMKGSQVYVIVQADGSNFTVQWDNVTFETLYIRFTATSLDGIEPPNISQILLQLPTTFVPGVGAEVNINQLATLVQQIDPNTLVTNAGFSLNVGGPYTATLEPSSKDKQFSVLTQNIFITPIVMLPQSATVPATTNSQFTAYGGTQVGYVYSILVNNSGGSINPSSGLYTAGPTIGIDTIQVVDSGANTATSTVTVI